MSKNEWVDKVKELVGNGNVEEAKKFIEDHKDELGDKVSEFSHLLGDNATGVVDKVKGFFKK